MDDAVGSQAWRLNHLYHIVDEKGEDVLFTMRPAQRAFFDGIWYYNIVLKARQLGFTTLIDLMALDFVLFRRNVTAVIIAETKDKAGDIFDAKVMHPYDRLPEQLKKWCPVVSRSADGQLSFGNGSSIRVMVSARSGTCQFLHVSEYGPVCARQPAKAKEIKTGSFPAVHSGGFVFVESTAMGNSGFFYDMVMQAQARKLAGKKLGKQDFRLHFFPWHQNPEYRTDPAGKVISSRLAAYFDGLADRHGVELDEEQMAWYATQEETLHEDMWSEFPSYVDEAFQTAHEGAYYARPFQDIYRQNRICDVPYDPNLPVYTAWDLGMSDETSVWFCQVYGMEIRLIDYYQNSGEGLAHYARVLQERGYRYARHFAPHDVAVRELGTGVSRMETARKLGIAFERIPTNADLMGGIDNCREMLGRCWFDEKRTEEGRKCLENYRKEWDENHGCFKTNPLHDWSSHGADAFRTLAQAWKMGLTGRTTAGAAVTPRGGLKRL